MPLTMTSRSTPYSALAVTSLRVAPLRFHSPYSAMMSSFHWSPPLVVVRPKNWNALQSQRFGPRCCVPACHASPEVSYSFLLANNHFWRSTEIDEHVSLTLL